MNHSVQIAPGADVATGQALIIQPMTLHDRAAWWAVSYEEDYAKIDDAWLFRRIKANTYFRTSYELGCAKEKFMKIW